MMNHEIVKYSYDQSKLQIQCDPWDVGASNLKLSEFDLFLQQKWTHAMDTGCFRYNLDELKTKPLPGRFQLVAQLNTKRFNERRKPQEMSSVAQPFDDSKFNFTKVFDREILFQMCPGHMISDSPSLMIINVSPLEFGNSLLVPSAYSRLPQILTIEALQMAMEASLLSTHRGFRIGFNSLCALASVNHLHFHVWYINYETHLETAPIKSISTDCSDVYELLDYPAKVFLYLLQDVSDIPSLTRKIHKFTSYLTSKDIAHNVLLIRGVNNLSNNLPCVRVFVWPRQSVLGAKDECVLNIAVCELAGQLPLKTEEVYKTFTEADFCNELQNASLEKHQLDELKQVLKNS